MQASGHPVLAEWEKVCTRDKDSRTGNVMIWVAKAIVSTGTTEAETAWERAVLIRIALTKHCKPRTFNNGGHGGGRHGPLQM